MGGYGDGRGGYTFGWTGLGGLPGDPALTGECRDGKGPGDGKRVPLEAMTLIWQ